MFIRNGAQSPSDSPQAGQRNAPSQAAAASSGGNSGRNCLGVGGHIHPSVHQGWSAGDLGIDALRAHWHPAGPGGNIVGSRDGVQWLGGRRGGGC